MSQTAFAALASASKRSQIDWEKGVSSPNADDLSRFHEAGADVLYIVTGERRTASLQAFKPDVLRQVIEGVEELQQAKKVKLPPGKKADLITLLYEQFSRAGAVEKPTVERYLRLVA